MQYNLKKGWSVLQDVHELGEHFGIFNDRFDPRRFGGDPSIQPLEPWEPIDRLEHLQLTFADNPWYGRALRQFNEAPWFYRNEFVAPDEGDRHAVLRFKGVDYYARVWLNGELLGEHEGYDTPFEFDVSRLIRWGEKNLLIVKVSSPWENDILPGFEYIRFCTVIRGMMKGTYEHSDTFVPRDVNPIGICDEVILETYNGVRLAEKPWVEPVLNEDYSRADVKLQYRFHNSLEAKTVRAVTQILPFGGLEAVAVGEQAVTLAPGDTVMEECVCVENPKLWTTWERGEPHRYTVVCRVFDGDRCILESTEHFGIRHICLVRNEQETTFYLNGEKLYFRGATYFPSIYTSALEHAHYVRDVEKAKAAGMNALRIHVHAEKDSFYDLCDEMGILLMQDTDFNWIHTPTKEWAERATKMVEEMFLRLRNHPSIFCWVLLNEARGDNYLYEYPGPQFVAAAERMDPQRPYILDSWNQKEPSSGDSHNYIGSLDGNHTHYSDSYGTFEKFNTEFGMDALPCYATLRNEPKLLKILGKVVDGIDEIQYYQYRHIKYMIEHYRTQKWAPCSGHFHFLFSDCAPTSHFGVYDWKGLPKYAVRAYEESNQPLGILMETKKHQPVAVWALNDLLKNYPDAVATWQITDETGACVCHGKNMIQLGENSRVLVTNLQDFVVEEGKEYCVRLELRAADGTLLAKNLYEKAFNPPEHIAGHPDYVHHGIGLRTYWAWMED